MIIPFIIQIENLQRQSWQYQYFQSGTMQQVFYMQIALKPKFYQARIDTSYQEVNHELNQNIKIKLSWSEIRYEVYSDSTTKAYIQFSMNWQSLTHNDGINQKSPYGKFLKTSFDSQDYKETSEREVIKLIIEEKKMYQNRWRAQ